MLNGFFNNLTPEQVAAVVSVFVFEEKVKEAAPLTKDELAKPLKEIQAQARIIAKVSQESKMAVNEDEYVQSFHWELMDVVYEWAHGKSFADIWYVLATPSLLLLSKLDLKLTSVIPLRECQFEIQFGKKKE